MRTQDIVIGESYIVEWQHGEVGTSFGMRTIVKATARETRVKFKAGHGEKSNGVRLTLDARVRATAVRKADGTHGPAELLPGHEIIVESRHLAARSSDPPQRWGLNYDEILAAREIRYDEQDAIAAALATLDGPEATMKGNEVTFGRTELIGWLTGMVASNAEAVTS